MYTLGTYQKALAYLGPRNARGKLGKKHATVELERTVNGTLAIKLGAAVLVEIELDEDGRTLRAFTWNADGEASALTLTPYRGTP